MEKLNCILLIDDDPVTNYLHESLIQSVLETGQILIARNGEEGLKMVNKGCPDGEAPALILVDLNMPVMDGIGFLKHYKEWAEQYPSPSVVAVLTTSTNPRDIEKVAQLEIAPLLPKPLQEEHLQTLVEAYWQRKSSRSHI
jgi:CheY-like chemotaxis protein